MTDQPPSPTPPEPSIPTPSEPPAERLVNTRKQAGQATSAKAFIADTPDEDDPLLAFRPYQHKQPRSNSITPDLQRRFIATLAATGIVRQAARSIGRSLEALYRLRGLTGAEGFAEAWEAALRRGVHRLEDCALERAIKGVPTPIVSGGKMLGTWDKPDNGLLRFLLQYRLPAIYSPKAQELGPGHPLYEEMKESLTKQLHEFQDQQRRDTGARALAWQTYRRRQFHHQRLADGPDAPMPPDPWDGSDENGYPALPASGFSDRLDRAAEILAQMEKEMPYDKPL